MGCTDRCVHSQKAAARTCKCGVGLFVTAVCLIVIGIFVPVLLNSVLNDGLRSLAVMDGPDALTYGVWSDNSDFPIRTEYYVYEIVNPNGTVNFGETPVVRERGPYVYYNYRKAFNVSWLDDGDRLRYKFWSYYLFARDESVGDPTVDAYWTVSPVFAAMLPILRQNVQLSVTLAQFIQLTTGTTGFYQNDVDILFGKALGNGQKPVPITVHELAFGYKNDVVLTLLNSMGMSWLPKDYPGTLYNMTWEEAVDKALFSEMYTGKSDISRVRMYTMYNNLSTYKVCKELYCASTDDYDYAYGPFQSAAPTQSPTTKSPTAPSIPPTRLPTRPPGSTNPPTSEPSPGPTSPPTTAPTRAPVTGFPTPMPTDRPTPAPYAAPTASLIIGTDGTQFPFDVQRSSSLPYWDITTFRSLTLEYVQDTNVHGIRTYRFAVPPRYSEAMWHNPNNVVYWGNASDGSYNISVALINVATFMTKPHFKDVGPEMAETCLIVAPYQEDVETYFDIEPISGSMVNLQGAVQASLQIVPLAVTSQDNPGYTGVFFPNMSMAYIPTFWVRQKVGIGQDDAKRFTSLVYGVILASDVTLYVGLILGALLLPLAVFLIFVSRQKLHSYVTDNEDVALDPTPATRKVRSSSASMAISDNHHYGTLKDEPEPVVAAPPERRSSSTDGNARSRF